MGRFQQRPGLLCLIVTLLVPHVAHSQERTPRPQQAGKYLCKILVEVSADAMKKFFGRNPELDKSTLTMRETAAEQHGLSEYPKESIDTLRSQLNSSGRQEAIESMKNTAEELRKQIVNQREALAKTPKYVHQGMVEKNVKYIEYMVERYEQEISLLKEQGGRKMPISPSSSGKPKKPSNIDEQIPEFNLEDYRKSLEDEVPSLKNYPYEVLQPAITAKKNKDYEDRGVLPPNCLAHVLQQLGTDIDEAVNPVATLKNGMQDDFAIARNPYSQLDTLFVNKGYSNGAVDVGSIAPNQIPAGSIAVYEAPLLAGYLQPFLGIVNPTVPSHVAIKRPDGRWESRLGHGGAIILHSNPHAVDGPELGFLKKLYLPK